MSSLNATAIFMLLGRMVAAILFILLMVLVFYSLRVEFKNDDMERFKIELSDTFLGSQLAQQKSIFTPEQLNTLEKSNGNIALFARNCEYEYNIEIESVGAKKACEKNSDCADYCKGILGTDNVDNLHDCNFELFGQDFCQCKKNNEWMTGYNWKFGYKPFALAKGTRAEFPAGVMMNGEAVPARLSINTYDSLLTKLSCAAQKAYATGQNVSLGIASASLPGTDRKWHIARRNDNVCMYNEQFTGPFEEDCRYMPVVPLKDFDISQLNEIISKGKNVVLTAYPLTVEANCPPLPDIIAAQGTVASVLLCAEEK